MCIRDICENVIMRFLLARNYFSQNVQNLHRLAIIIFLKTCSCTGAHWKRGHAGICKFWERELFVHNTELGIFSFLVDIGGFISLAIFWCGARIQKGKFPAEDCGIYDTLFAPVHWLKHTGFFNDSGCGFIFLFHTPKRRVGLKEAFFLDFSSFLSPKEK